MVSDQIPLKIQTYLRAMAMEHRPEPSDPARQVADLLAGARRQSGFSLRQLAQLADTSHATLSAYEHGRKVPSVTTFLRILEACNTVVDFHLQRRIRHADGLDRGEELTQALILAEQFPSRVGKTLDAPVFPTPALSESA